MNLHKRKKIFKFFVVLLIAFSSAFAFAHCDREKKDSDKKVEKEAENITSEQVKLQYENPKKILS